LHIKIEIEKDEQGIKIWTDIWYEWCSTCNYE